MYYLYCIVSSLYREREGGGGGGGVKDEIFYRIIYYECNDMIEGFKRKGEKFWDLEGDRRGAGCK